jgi:hypothetical protein
LTYLEKKNKQALDWAFAPRRNSKTAQMHK